MIAAAEAEEQWTNGSDSRMFGAVERHLWLCCGSASFSRDYKGTDYMSFSTRTLHIILLLVWNKDWIQSGGPLNPWSHLILMGVNAEKIGWIWSLSTLRQEKTLVDHENEDTRRQRGDYIVSHDEKPKLCLGWWLMMTIMDLMMMKIIVIMIIVNVLYEYWWWWRGG